MFGTEGSITLSVGDTYDYLQKIRRNMIGFDEWQSRFDTPIQNYPPYNTIKLSNHEYRVEVAAAGRGGQCEQEGKDGERSRR